MATMMGKVMKTTATTTNIEMIVGVAMMMILML